MPRVTAYLYELKDYKKAVEHKERIGGILRREFGPLDKSWYIVYRVPPPEKWAND